MNKCVVLTADKILLLQRIKRQITQKRGWDLKILCTFQASRVIKVLGLKEVCIECFA